jgi:formamidopyrimidine-DNA glycosylase
MLFYRFDKSRKYRYLLYRITSKIAIVFHGVRRKQFPNKIGIIRSLQPLYKGEKMPELPEVETLCRQLRKAIVGQTVRESLTLDKKKLPDFPELVNRQVVSVNRRGKNIVLTFDDGQVLAMHLRMTGRLLWQKDQTEAPKYTRFIMTFPRGRIFFIDPRRFMTLTRASAPPSACGREPLESIDPLYLVSRSQNRKGPIKAFLLDQSVIAGIGNIYACEILHQAGIAPARPAQGLNETEWRRILSVTGAVLKKAITCRGSSISDWRDFHGKKGAFQHELGVYGRAGLPCPRCGKNVIRCSIGGRGTYFCPGCQT